MAMMSSTSFLLLLVMALQVTSTSSSEEEQAEGSSMVSVEETGNRTLKHLSAIGLLESEKLRVAFSELLAGDRSRKVAFSEKVMSNTALQQFLERHSMKIRREDTAAREPHLNINIMANSSTIYVVKSVNQYYYWKYVQNVSTVLIFSLIVVGNISILHRLKSCRRRRSNVNYFIVQLAIADLFVGVFSVTLDSIFRLTMTFPFGLYTCRIYKYMSSSFTYSATYLLVALSFDRWEAVVKPLAFTQNHRRGQHLVLAAWLISFICASPVFINLRIKEVQGRPQCYMDHSPLAWRYYVVYLSTSLFVLPALLIAICYVHIVYTIWGKGQLLKNQRRALRRQLSAQQRARSKESSASLAAAAASGQVNLSPDPIGDKLAQPHLDQVDELSEPTDVESSSSLEEDEEEEEEEDNEDEEENTDEETDRKQVHPQQPPAGRKLNGSGSGRVTYACSANQVDSGQVVLSVNNNGNGNSSSNSNNNNHRPKRASSRRRKRGVQVTSSSLSCSETRNHHNYLAQQHGSGVIPRARVKTIKMTLVIVAAFVLCWLPFCVINLCSAYGILDKSSVPKTALLTLSQSLAHLNSAANPIIFWLFSSKRTGARPAPSADSQGNRRLARRPRSLCNTLVGILCCRCTYLFCCARRSFITTDSRMFECTGTSANQNNNNNHHNTSTKAVGATTPPHFDNPALDLRC